MFDLLLWYARHGLGRGLRRSAFRKFCRRHRGEARQARTRDGVRLETVLGDSVDNAIFVHGEFEPVTTALFRALAPRVRALVDVGCNIGYFSTLFAQLCPGTPVIAIDANPRMVDRARRNVALNPGMQVDFLAEGLAGAPGCLRLHVPRERHSLASFAYAAGEEKSAAVDTLEVPVTTLSTVLARHADLGGIFVKIDTEGFEHAVLGGLAVTDVHRIDALLIEANYRNLQRAGVTLEQLLGFPWMAQFETYEVDDSAGVFAACELAALRTRQRVNTNILFVRPGLAVAGISV